MGKPLGRILNLKDLNVMKKDLLQKCVEKYKINPSQKLKRKIVEEAKPLILYIIKKIKIPEDPLIKHEDLYSSAYIGLSTGLKVL